MTKGRRLHTKSFSCKQAAEAAIAAEWQPKVAAHMMLRGSLVSRNIIANVAYERRFYFIQKGKRPSTGTARYHHRQRFDSNSSTNCHNGAVVAHILESHRHISTVRKRWRHLKRSQLSLSGRGGAGNGA